MEALWRRDFVIASEEEADSGAESVSSDGGHAVELDDRGVMGFAEEELGRLHSLLVGKQYDRRILDAYEETYVWDELHGPWLMRLPDDFVGGLAKCDDESMTSLAQRWVADWDPFVAKDAPPRWVESTVCKLVKLARRATAEGKKMYWQVPSC